jgi:hypothetical protein
MLETFVEWAYKVKSESDAGETKVSVTIGPSCDNPSARLDVDTPRFIALLVCWKSGDYFVHVVDVEDETDRLVKYGVIFNEIPLNNEFDEFCDLLKINSD